MVAQGWGGEVGWGEMGVTANGVGVSFRSDEYVQKIVNGDGYAIL